MEENKSLQRKAEFLLAAVIIARSTSYLLSKISMQSLGPLTLFRGMLLGGTFFAVMTAELFGLRVTDSSTTSFLENTAIVFVPLFEAVLLRKSPRPSMLLSAAVTLFGIGLLTMRGSIFTFHAGELLCVLAGICLTNQQLRARLGKCLTSLCRKHV